MVITQPYRILIKEAIRKKSEFIKGIVLDAGSGSVKRYSDFFNYDKYLTLDVDAESRADIIASVEAIPLSDSSIDSIVCTGVIGDIFQPELPIREFNRILKEGGYCLLTDNFGSLMHNQPHDYFRFTNFYLERLFRENGFEIIVSERVGGFHSLMLQLSIEYLLRLFRLNERKYIGRIASKLFYFLFKLAKFLDDRDKSQANKCAAIAWLIVAKKINNN